MENGTKIIIDNKEEEKLIITETIKDMKMEFFEEKGRKPMISIVFNLKLLDDYSLNDLTNGYENFMESIRERNNWNEDDLKYVHHFELKTKVKILAEITPSIKVKPR